MLSGAWRCTSGQAAMRPQPGHSTSFGSCSRAATSFQRQGGRWVSCGVAGIRLPAMRRCPPSSGPAAGQPTACPKSMEASGVKRAESIPKSNSSRFRFREPTAQNLGRIGRSSRGFCCPTRWGLNISKRPVSRQCFQKVLLDGNRRLGSCSVVQTYCQDLTVC